MPPSFDHFLHWGEKFLRTDLRYSISGGFYLTLTQVTSAIVSFGLTIAFANLLPVETYGTYKYVLAAYSLLALAALPGVDTAVLQAVSRGHDGSFLDGVWTKLRWGLLGALASFVYAGYLYAEGDVLLGNIFIMVGIALPFMESFALWTAFLNGKKLFKSWAVIDIATQGVSALSLVGTMFFTKSLIAIIVAYFLPYIVVRIAAVFWISHQYTENSERDELSSSYGRSLTIFQIISRAIVSADQVVLFHLLGPAQVAIFSLATAIPNRAQALLRISGTLAFPKFAERSGKEIAETLPRKMFLFAIAILGMCLAYVALAPFIFKYLFPQYMPSLEYSQVVIFFILSAITYPFSSYLFAHKKLFENYVVAIGNFIVKVGCLLVLVPLLGLWGAVIGMLATSLSTIVLSLWMLWRERSSVAVADKAINE